MAGPPLRGVWGHSQATPIVRDPPQASKGWKCSLVPVQRRLPSDGNKYLLAINSDQSQPSCFDGKRIEVDPPRNVPISGREMINLIQHVTSYFPLARKLFLCKYSSLVLWELCPFSSLRYFPRGYNNHSVATV